MKTMMKSGMFFGIILSLFSCSKENANNPNVVYKTYFMVLNNVTNASLPVYDVDFDINGDTQKDFRISGHFDSVGGDTTVSTILLGDASNTGQNEFITYQHSFPSGDPVNLLKLLDKGEKINGSSFDFNYYDAAVLNAFHGDKLFYSVGINDTGEKLVGFKFMKDGEVHYGWFTIYLSADKRVLVVKDGAYNKVAGEDIKAGER